MKKINKKSKVDKLCVANKITLGKDIRMYTDKKHSPKTFIVFRWLIAFISTFSVLIMAHSFVPTEINGLAILFFSLVSTIMFSVVKSKNKVVSLFGFFCAAFIMLLILINKDKTVNGFFIYVSEYLTKADQPNTFFSSYIKDLSVSDCDNAISFFYLTLSMLTGFGTTAGCVYGIYFPILFLFTFPIFELGLYWGWEPNIPACCLLVICWVVILSINIVNHKTNKAGRKNTYSIYKRGKTYFFTSPGGKESFNGTAARFTALICAAVFAFVILFSAVTGFTRPKIFNVYRKSISKTAENFTMNNLIKQDNNENVGESFGFFGIKAVGGTNGGILGETNGISFNGSTALKISLPEFKYPMYLKGYCGGEYKNNSWNAIKIDKNSPCYTAFRNDGFYPQDITDINLGVISDKYQNQIPKQEINVEIKGASTKFAYAPYGTNYSGSNKDKKMQMCEESYIIPNKKEFTFTYRDLGNVFALANKDLGELPSVFEDVIYSQEITDSYPEYTSFVKENYLQTTNSDALNEAFNTIINDYLPEISDQTQYYDKDGKYDEMSNPYTYQQVYKAIAQYFDDNFEYTLNPGATPEGKDFIDYFLTKQKKGYCSYFATAATELLRMFGFPARYAEGYIVLPDQYHQGEIEIKDNAAHAWTEVYFEKIGWIPAEFTPGYSNDNPNLSSETLSSSKNDSSSLSSSSAVTSSSSKADSSSLPSTTSATSSSQTSSQNTQKRNDSQNKSSSDSDGKNSSVATAGGGVNNNDKQGKSSSKQMLAVIIFGTITISAVATIFIRRKILLKRKYKDIFQSGINNGAKAIYRYTLKYLSLLDIEIYEKLTDKQLLESIIKQCHKKEIAIDKNNLKVIFENAVKAYMSENTIEEKDFENSINAMEKILNETVLPQLNAYKKCKAMFIDCLF